jgi:hypothetical protein
MFRKFKGTTSILGVKEGRRNCKGFEGEIGTEERMFPGFIPDRTSGREVHIESCIDELNKAIASYNLSFEVLPRKVRIAIEERSAFTLVEGIDPTDVYKNKIDAKGLIKKIFRHDQATFAIEQIKSIYAAHNGTLINDGKPLQFEKIEPYLGFESPIIIPIPDELTDDNGNIHSTTLDGKKNPGQLILYTSKLNMPNKYKTLKPHWRVTYKTEKQTIGSIPVSDLIPITPGKNFVYADVILEALKEQAQLGRARPVDSSFINAINNFTKDNLIELAKKINDKQKVDLDEEILSEIHKENQLLNKWKDKWLEPGGLGTGGTGDGEGEDTDKKREPTPPVEWGSKPDSIEIDNENAVIKVGRGSTLYLPSLLNPVVRDEFGKPVPNVKLDWISSDKNIAYLLNSNEGDLISKNKGKCEIQVKVSDTDIISKPVIFQIHILERVSLEPTKLKIPLGRRKLIKASVKTDDGLILTDVLVNWKHDSNGKEIVKIHQTGWVTGNIIGQTTVSAGVDDLKSHSGGIWSSLGTLIKVIESTDPKKPGTGYPQLKVTDFDRDRITGKIRESDSTEPPLWQSVADQKLNIWWLNLGAKDAQIAYSMRDEDPKIWRFFHAKTTAEMIIQARMAMEYTNKQEAEEKEFWAMHKDKIDNFQIDIWPDLWGSLNKYIETGNKDLLK